MFGRSTQSPSPGPESSARQASPSAIVINFNATNQKAKGKAKEDSDVIEIDSSEDELLQEDETTVQGMQFHLADCSTVYRLRF